MTKYYDSLNEEIKEYFKVLSPEFPAWLHEYIDTPEMARIGGIGMDCGNGYTKLFPAHKWYSNLDHSVGVALIIWNFTHDKKQTLAGLFHDIATPVFKHCIDFMNGDSETQESTEERTTEIIENSEAIMRLLKRDGIKVSEVDDYKIYPLADNDSPKLSADRFEYNFSWSVIIYPLWDMNDFKNCYEDITVLTNEEGVLEFGFKHLDKAERFIEVQAKMWPWWICDEDRIAMQFLADICKEMHKKGYLSIDDLYTFSEAEVIDKIKKCKDSYIAETFRKWEKSEKCYVSDIFIDDKYCINVKTKRRYIVPLVKDGNLYGRVYDLSLKAKKDIDEYLKIPIDGYVYLDFEF